MGRVRSNFKSLTLWTIVANFFIVVGAGHGILCIGFLEILSIAGTLTGHGINNGYFSLALTSSYEQSLGTVVLFSFPGQILLLASFMIKERSKIWIKLFAIALLWIGFYYLIHNFENDSLSQVGFFFGIPFLVFSGILTYRLIKGLVVAIGFKR